VGDSRVELVKKGYEPFRDTDLPSPSSGVAMTPHSPYVSKPFRQRLTTDWRFFWVNARGPKNLLKKTPHRVNTVHPCLRE